MDLGAYLTPEHVMLLSGTTKAEALAQLVGVLAGAADEIGRDELEQAVWRREKMMSTGIGNGLAIPHVRLPGLPKALMAVGVSRDGLTDYDSLDGEPVRVVILIAAPQGEHETYIRLLAKAADVLKQPELREKILGAEEPSEIHRIFTGSAA